ncbi:neuropeptide F isoform X1 [Anopheles arabiensis]|uniref:neuropeptide F isoform X1 n=1 Tax=Anopheles arabiensis TaxID=7173 RepID=UPI001AADAD5E|nr:neuropeptide F isoform X1 [Anopheles arabiensis]XP_040224120.1 neuropeptide F isoform X1 [Anopheles coluzzii]XP_041788500.1 neuropeptide F isoform X1 [Anopheles merus]
MASGTFTQRLLVALMIFALIADLSTLVAARPQDSDAASVAAAIRYLQELETKHAQHARPRLIRSELPPNINGVHSGLDKIIGYFILEAIDRAHSTDARPRFGKRGGYLNPAIFGQDEQENLYRLIGRIQHFRDEQLPTNI